MSEYRRRLMMIKGTNNSNILNDYLTMVALEDGLQAKLSAHDCEYCIDGNGKWKPLSADAETEAVNRGHAISFRGNIIPSSNSSYHGIGTFSVSKKYELHGNAMSMLFGDEGCNSFSLSGKTDAFRRLFNNSTTLVSAKNLKLPATTLANLCYQRMFANCTSLIDAPELPALTMMDNCYGSMFIGCTSLVTPPKLPATRLYSQCYNAMFSGCTSLTAAPDLLAASLSQYSYYQMFYNCANLRYIKMLATSVSASSALTNWVSGVSSEGTFVKHPNVSLNIGSSGIPSGWTVETATD